MRGSLASLTFKPRGSILKALTGELGRLQHRDIENKRNLLTVQRESYFLLQRPSRWLLLGFFMISCFYFASQFTRFIDLSVEILNPPPEVLNSVRPTFEKLLI